MPAPRDQELLAEAARMYYQEDRSQAAVAEALGLSRSNVSRMLTAARDQGIVEIRIHDPSGRDVDLERRLQEQFGLRTVRVAAMSGLEHAGRLGARWLTEHLTQGVRVAVSWGTTIQALVSQVPDDGDRDDVEVVPLVGGLSSVDAAITGEELIRDLAGRLGGRMQRLHAPAVLGSVAGRNVLLAEPSVQAALQAARSASIAIVGIGTVGSGSSDAIVGMLDLDDAERTAFDAAGPVGDMCARFFDAEGRALSGPADDRVLAVTLDDLAAIATVVGVAAGREKRPGTLGALRSGVLDVLVCDRALALGVLA